MCEAAQFIVNIIQLRKKPSFIVKPLDILILK